MSLSETRRYQLVGLVLFDESVTNNQSEKRNLRVCFVCLPKTNTFNIITYTKNSEIKCLMVFFIIITLFYGRVWHSNHSIVYGLC